MQKIKRIKNSKAQNVFVAFLRLLHVKHTKAFSNKYYNEHPHKYNLFGLSRMLSDYGIGTKGIRATDKENALQELDVPFVAHTGGDFVVVFKITPEKVYYLWQGKEVVNDITEFLEAWSGAVLLAEADGNSTELGYKENRKKELAVRIQKYLLLFATGLLAGLSCFLNHIGESPGLTFSLIINLTGIYTCWLLVLKQLNIHSEYADKICSLFKQGDCNNVLESKAAKLGGIIGWSEIGLGYFISNTLIILLQPALFSYLVLINICALPYSVWSVWYQKFKAKQWCPLCLTVQLLLCMVFLTNLVFDTVHLPLFQIEDILLTGAVFLIPPLTINLLLPNFSQSRKTERITQEFNALKTAEDVFEAFLKKQTRYDADKHVSKILFGNPESKILITVLTNPHCSPCARMHMRVEQLLRETNNSVCVQYVFSSFNRKLESSARFLIAAYFTYSGEKVKDIYREWFKEGTINREEFFRRHTCVKNEKTEQELQSHTRWKEETRLRTTPAVLVNGYKLPDNYKIEDLKYFTDLNVDIK
ncbi:MAG: thioredoxin domain-containing protein [Prevotella sp.]|jgi:protein-disulfide isomerase/uncharacterized membrane protein|nr:thioredoxin domain-containing protein [Prevotella sp.]